MTDAKMPDRTSTALHILKLSCPNCGQAKLYRAYLKQVDACSACGIRWQDYRADDGPAWLTIIILGHILVPLAVWFAIETDVASWQIMIGVCALAGTLVLLLLPFSKAIFLTILHRTKAGAHRS